MDKPGFIIYKCRRCGELHRPIHVPHTVQFLVDAAFKTHTLYQVHVCNDRGYGVSDIFGADPDMKGGEK
ncbi:MAG: hypothetical protein WC911_01650 [Thermoleophilia bacterium]